MLIRRKTVKKDWREESWNSQAKGEEGVGGVAEREEEEGMIEEEEEEDFRRIPEQIHRMPG